MPDVPPRQPGKLQSTPSDASSMAAAPRAAIGRLRRWILTGAGTLFVGLGLIGAFVPILPTAPFLLLAAACFAHGSERMHRWLLGHRLFGRHLRDYRAGRGLAAAPKALTLLLLWATMGFSVAVVLPERPWWPKALLLAIALAVTFHILRVGRRRG